MINTITYKGENLTWDYKIAACLDCPLYPHIKEWEDDPDIRKDKCYTSGCTYNKNNARAISEDIALIMNGNEDEEY